MNVLCFGAHPDDAEFHAGGTLLKWSRQGHAVHVVSLTNGDLGHHAIGGGPLAQRRARECRRAAEIAGYESECLDLHDGELLPTLEVRRRVIEIIRKHRADIVLTHRPWDYHPDHRYAATTVQDAAFMVTVPHCCPHVPPLSKNPVFLYMMDAFTKPLPFQPDAGVDIDEVVETKWDLLDAMESQFYEWLPWLDEETDQVPEGLHERKSWMKAKWSPLFSEFTDRHRAVLEAHYGARAADIVFAEFFEICEYGRRPGPEEIRELFPMI